MNRSLSILFAALLLGACTQSAAPADDFNGPRVSVQGEAMVEVAPDLLEVQFSVTHIADEVAVATADVSTRTKAALTAVKQAGVADEDIRALSISVQPQWDWHEGERRFRGHEASRTVELKLRDVSAWPALLAALVAAGVDRIDSVEPSHSDRQAIARDALRDALRDARARADVLAAAAGAEVTEVHSITETGRNYTVARQHRAEVTMAAPPPAADAGAYEPGMITITSNVQATFRMRILR